MRYRPTRIEKQGRDVTIKRWGLPVGFAHNHRHEEQEFAIIEQLECEVGNVHHDIVTVRNRRQRLAVFKACGELLNAFIDRVR